MKCLYLAIMSLDPTGRGRQRWTNRWKAALNAFDITFDGRLSAGRKQQQRQKLHRYLDRPSFPQGFLWSSQLGLRVTTGARGELRLVPDRGWMPSEAWLARSAMAVL